MPEAVGAEKKSSKAKTVSGKVWGSGIARRVLHGEEILRKFYDFYLCDFHLIIDKYVCLW